MTIKLRRLNLPLQQEAGVDSSDGIFLQDAAGARIGNLPNLNAEAAAFFVRACNHHEALLTALARWRSHFPDCPGDQAIPGDCHCGFAEAVQAVDEAKEPASSPWALALNQSSGQRAHSHHETSLTQALQALLGIVMAYRGDRIPIRDKTINSAVDVARELLEDLQGTGPATKSNE